jgi:phytoene synthase
MVAGEDPDQPALQGVAMAYALTGLIRAVPHYAAQGRCMLPDDLMRAHGLCPDTLHRPESQNGLRAVIRAVRETAENFLLQGRGGHAGPSGHLIRLHKVVCAQYLNKIKRLGDNPFDPRLAVPPPLRAVRLWMVARKRKTLENNL